MKKLPEKWFIRGCRELVEYLNGEDTCYDGDDPYLGYYKRKNEKWTCTTRIELVNDGYVEISLNDYIKIINSKLIGYKLKEEFKIDDIVKAVLAIEGNRCIGTEIKRTQTLSINAKASIIKLRAAGVLDLWFEPVYEEEKFKVGDWITVTDGIYGGWLNNTSTKTFQITKAPTMYFGGEYFQVKNPLTGEYGGLYAEFRRATKQEIEKYKFPEIVIKGYTVKLDNNQVIIGCQKLSKEFVLKLGELVSENYIETEYDKEILTVIRYLK